MYDLHCHILPGIDDGARDAETSLAMARMFVDQGVTCVACTPHILPGVYHNTGPEIRAAVAALQQKLDDAGIPLLLVPGADNHVVPDFVQAIAAGRLLTLADTSYVLVEPPHHVAPARLDELFFSILLGGYVPVLTHPERLTWIESKYALVTQLAERGVWMQITSGSLRGGFGKRPQYWAERMLDDGLVKVIATDAHDASHRRPDLAEGMELAERRVGRDEAVHMVVTRPRGVLLNCRPTELPAPQKVTHRHAATVHDADDRDDDGRSGGRAIGRLRRLFSH